MTIQEAKQFLLDIGRSTCSCKYGSEVQMIELARKLKEEMENKNPSVSEGVSQATKFNKLI